jgi:hypothetical protein
MQTESTNQSLSEWSPDATARLSVSAPSIDAALGGTLQAVLNVARATPVNSGPGTADMQSISAPIRGQGVSFGEVLYEMINDLLAQLDANGAGLTTARLDGVLATDDDGYSAWGAVLGEAGGARPPVGLSMEGTPGVSQTGDGQTTVDVLLARS